MSAAESKAQSTAAAAVLTLIMDLRQAGTTDELEASGSVCHLYFVNEGFTDSFSVALPLVHARLLEYQGLGNLQIGLD